MIKILTVIGRLLDYPTSELCQHRQELVEAMRDTPYLPPDTRQALATQIEQSLSHDIYDLQVRYDGLFERGRSLSLLLFEHVHGESRERGQAMVDLLDVYFDAGMHPRADELPDYIPLFLEFLSTRDDEVAAKWLHDVGHILLLLAERLRKRGAWEAELFDALLIISGAPLHDEKITEKVLAETDDSTLEALDKAWEDKEVHFDTPIDGEDSCPMSNPAITTEQPLVYQPNRNAQRRNYHA